MSGKRYTEEFKIEAVKQVTGGGYKVGKDHPKSSESCSGPLPWQ